MELPVEVFKWFVWHGTQEIFDRKTIPCFLVETSPAAPWQLEGICADGRYIYIRERQGLCRVHISASAGELYHSEPELEIDVPETFPYDEVIALIEEHLGLLLVVVNEAWGDD